MRRTGTDVVAQLTERNRKFEAFLREKLADLESKIIPTEPTTAFEDENVPSPAEMPDETGAAPPDDTSLTDEPLFTGKLLGSGAPTVPVTPPVTSSKPSPPAEPDEEWLVGFLDEDTPLRDTDDTPTTDSGDGDDDDIDAPPDVDEALPDNDGRKKAWA